MQVKTVLCLIVSLLFTSAVAAPTPNVHSQIPSLYVHITDLALGGSKPRASLGKP